MIFVKRIPKWYDRGNLLNDDFDNDDFTKDGAFHTLDLSSIIPVGTKMVNIAMRVNSILADSVVLLTKVGNDSGYNIVPTSLPVAGKDMRVSVDVMVNADREIQYLCTNTTWNKLYMTISRYYK